MLTLVTKEEDKKEEDKGIFTKIGGIGNVTSAL
jgi:hypothetical protein